MGHCSSSPLRPSSGSSLDRRFVVGAVKQTNPQLKRRPKMRDNFTIQMLLDLGLELKSKMGPNDSDETVKTRIPIDDPFVRTPNQLSTCSVMGEHLRLNLPKREHPCTYELQYGAWLYTLYDDSPSWESHSRLISSLSGPIEHNYPQRPLAVYLHLMPTYVEKGNHLSFVPPRCQSMGSLISNGDCIELMNDQELSIRLSCRTTEQSLEYAHQCLADILNLVDPIQFSSDSSASVDESLSNIDTDCHCTQQTTSLNRTPDQYSQYANQCLADIFNLIDHARFSSGCSASLNESLSNIDPDCHFIKQEVEAISDLCDADESSLTETPTPRQTFVTHRGCSTTLDLIYSSCDPETCPNKRRSSYFGVARLIQTVPNVRKVVSLDPLFTKWLMEVVELHLNAREAITNLVQDFADPYGTPDPKSHQSSGELC